MECLYPRADFWESYYRNLELQLPVGTYEVTAFCDFSFNDTAPFDEYKQEVKFILRLSSSQREACPQPKWDVV
jgi:hypothetical protein